MRTRRSLAMLMAAVAVVAVVITLALKAAAIQDYHRRAPASAKLLRPIVQYYARISESDREYQGNKFANARCLIGNMVVQLAETLDYACVALYRPHDDGPGMPTGWMSAETEFRTFLLYPSFVCNDFRDAARYAEESAYHSRLRDYYQQLWDEHRTEISPWPRAMETERLARQETIRRIARDPTYDLNEDLPSDLDPYPNRPKRKRPPRPPWIWYGNSL